MYWTSVVSRPAPTSPSYRSMSRSNGWDPDRVDPSGVGRGHLRGHVPAGGGGAAVAPGQHRQRRLRARRPGADRGGGVEWRRPDRDAHPPGPKTRLRPATRSTAPRGGGRRHRVLPRAPTRPARGGRRSPEHVVVDPDPTSPRRRPRPCAALAGPAHGRRAGTADPVGAVTQGRHRRHHRAAPPGSRRGTLAAIGFCVGLAPHSLLRVHDVEATRRLPGRPGRPRGGSTTWCGTSRWRTGCATTGPDPVPSRPGHDPTRRYHDRHVDSRHHGPAASRGARKHPPHAG